MSFACASWTQIILRNRTMSNLFDWFLNYFTQKVCSIYLQVLAREGLRVISVNTNYCNNFNFWLALNFNDPHKHLHWLYQELKKAEDNRESVYILGHIPTGSESCTGKKWGLNCDGERTTRSTYPEFKSTHTRLGAMSKAHTFLPLNPSIL